jgi:hypothetical protein
MLRKAIGLLMIVVFPISVLAQANEAAMVYGKGSVRVNGNLMPAFTLAIFPGDSIETGADSTANVNAPGASISLQAESFIKYAINSVTLQRGTVSVVASRAMQVNAGELAAVPASSNETEFEVFEAGALIHVLALRNDVNVTCRSESVHLLEGEELTRDDQGHCRKAAKTEGAYPPATGNTLTTPWTWVTVAVVGGILCAVFCVGDGGSNPPMSASSTSGK